MVYLLRHLSCVLEKSSKNQTSVVVAVATVSALLVAAAPINENSYDTGTQEEHKEEDTKDGLVTSTRNKFIPDVLRHPMPLYQLPPCRCESSSVQPDAPRRASFRKHIQRQRTIRRMDLYSTKDALESRYLIKWDGPPLGVGAFGSVYLATNKVTDEEVALKKISKEFTDEECFQREMRALLHIRESGGHPNICALRENFDFDESFCLILDFIGGGEMFDHLICNGAYSEADAARLLGEVASALAFLHGIGVIHADLKPENIMLSTVHRRDAVVKLVDFGTAEVLSEDEIDDENMGSSHLGGSGLTPAYCPPESFYQKQAIEPPRDMWSLGVILYIMLTGVHPFDLTGESTDEQIEARIKNPHLYIPPIRNCHITQHLSESAIDLIEQLMDRDPKTRLTAGRMLEHPWVRGETATTDIIAGIDERLNKFRVFKSKVQAKFFQDLVSWSDHEEDTRRKTSLIERSFRSFDMNQRRFVTTKEPDHKRTGPSDDDNTEEDDGPSLSMSDFQGLLSENMKDKHFPKGHTVYHEGDIGNHMYFITSGVVEVATKDGSKVTRKQGDFFGEGGLLHPKKIRSATLRCKTPVHAMEISREYFEKYVATSESGLLLTLREKDKIRKRNRAKAILRLQANLHEVSFKMGDNLFIVGDEGDTLYILERGKIDVLTLGKHVFSVMPGNVCGEHSLLTGRPRNTTTFCVSEEGCVAYQMMGRDFRKLMELSPNTKDSLCDLSYRRDFKKAVVYRLKKEFPYENPKEAFDAADIKKCGVLDKEVIGHLLRDMDPEYSDEAILEVIKAIDLTKSGEVSFDEFRKVFVGDIRTSASI